MALRRCGWKGCASHLRDTQSILNESDTKLSTLVVDYVKEAAEFHHVKFHAPLLIGARQDGMRGLYLAPNHDVPKNAPLFTVPYTGFITNEQILKCNGAPQDLTLDLFKKHWKDDELLPLVPAVHLATHAVLQMDRLPRRSAPIVDAARKDIIEGKTEANSEAISQYNVLLSLHTSQLMPWCRMLDDEDWNEEHITQLYAAALDQFQQTNYEDLAKRYSKAVTALHVELGLECKLESVKRLSRLIIARYENLPVKEELGRSSLNRRLTRLWRRFKKEQLPRQNAIVPVLEMINHSGRPNVNIRVGMFDGVPAVRAFSMSKIRGGAELGRYYNFALDKSNALFRFGFLPFEIVSVPNMNQWKEHYVDGIYPQLGEVPEEQRLKEERLNDEVGRLQRLFEKAKTR